MQILKTIQDVREWRNQYHEVAFVPTMGNLHDGHLSLVNEAQKYCENVIVSIFVNPLQFGVGEDLDSYPRTLNEDSEKLINAGVNALFLPTEEVLYGDNEPFIITPPQSLIGDLCGKNRPGHFEGVATVVAKFFNIVSPTYACFGRKDYQQLKVIENMVQALNFDVKIIPVAIERSDEGLALSSRNGYLSLEEKNDALLLNRVLQEMKQEIELAYQSNIMKDLDFRELESRYSALLQNGGFMVDYLSIREQMTLKVANSDESPLVILVAAKIGKTRLLDNIEISFESIGL